MNLWRSTPPTPAAPALPPADPTADPAPETAVAILDADGVPVHAAADGTVVHTAAAAPPVILDGTGQPAVAAAGEMPFLDHLEELRWHLFKALGGVAVMCVLCFVFADWIITNVLLAQTKSTYFMYDILGVDAVDVVLQNRTVTGQFFAYYGTILAAALVLGSPVIVYQLWKFIEPGLYPGEKKGVRFAAAFATFFFACGIAFGYLILSPYALQYFASFSISSSILNEFDINRYFSMLIGWTFSAGLLFEAPVVMVVLARLGIVNSAMLSSSRRFALVLILILAAVLTPPDPLSMIIMAIPLLLLYELSIWLVKGVERGLRRDAEKAAAEEAARQGTAVVVVPAEASGDGMPS